MFLFCFCFGLFGFVFVGLFLGHRCEKIFIFSLGEKNLTKATKEKGH